MRISNTRGPYCIRWSIARSDTAKIEGKSMLIILYTAVAPILVPTQVRKHEGARHVLFLPSPPSHRAQAVAYHKNVFCDST